ncbi:hypothetical protein [Burkholderia sp. Z1]|uniref:hypothetical protein n=1 Tax=Burkholderia sp. Z1 TaxID=2759039 RepID=UPI001868FAD2|nr:hypothetical protein [Burkholderia sp. Z1]
MLEQAREQVRYEMSIKRVSAYRAQLLAVTAIGWVAANSVLAAGLESPSSTTTSGQGETVLAKSAREVGIRRCYAAVDQVSARMFANTRHVDVALDWDRRDPDVEPFFALAGLEYPNASAVLSLTTVPAQSGGCTILVERISSAPLSCNAVAASELRGYKGTELVKAVTVYANPGRSRETVTLVDTPPACLIIRRQVQFRWGATE